MPSSLYHSHLICKFYFLSSPSSNTQTRSISHLRCTMLIAYQLGLHIFNLYLLPSELHDSIHILLLTRSSAQVPHNYIFTDSSLATLLHILYSPASLNFLTSFHIQLHGHPCASLTSNGLSHWTIPSLFIRLWALAHIFKAEIHAHPHSTSLLYSIFLIFSSPMWEFIYVTVYYSEQSYPANCKVLEKRVSGYISSLNKM